MLTIILGNTNIKMYNVNFHVSVFSQTTTQWINDKATFLADQG